VADSVRLLDPRLLDRNPENPRLIFRQQELDALQDSISQQGILVPLSVFQEHKRFILLDGERRWRCALKLGLSTVPVIIQPKPDRLQNIMMMFAIHNARRDWDPLPTALKLEELENEFDSRNSRKPTERELAGLASLSRGEVRRLKKLLALPAHYREELLSELEKPKTKQEITVDHVIEATKAVESLRRRNIVTDQGEEPLRQSILAKFRSGVIKNTVEPRKLARLSRAVQRGEVTLHTAQAEVGKLVKDPSYAIEDAFRNSVQVIDYQHGIEQLATRLVEKLREHRARGYAPSEGLLLVLRELESELRVIKRS
jgi:ParB family chromosome partitioning protein